MTAYYPILLRLEGKLCVVIGGGAVAERKIAGLLEAGATITVVSPEVTSRLHEWAQAGAIRCLLRRAVADDLDEAALVFAATNQIEVNRWIALEAERRGIPVNVADHGESGDFLTPSVVRRGDLVLSVSASGAGPAFTARIARELADRYGLEYGVLTALLRRIREIVKSEVVDRSERRGLLKAAVGDEALSEWIRLGIPEDQASLLAKLRDYRDRGND